METKNTNPIYNWESLKIILPYLKLSDLFNTVTLSKEWQYNLKEYFKKYHLPETYTHLSSDVLQAMRIMYNRKIILRDAEGVKQINFPHICNKIEMGNYATKLETLEGHIYIIRNNILTTIGKKEWSNNESVFRVPSKFHEVKCCANYIYLICDTYIVRHTTVMEDLFHEEETFHFEGNIENTITSASSILVVIKNEKSKENQYFISSHKELKFVLVELPFQLENPTTNIILDQPKHALVISNQGIVYEVDVSNEPKINEFKLLKGKSIAKIQHGSKHYFAYEKKKQPIQKWTNNEVLKWADEEGFDEYTKILSAEKVTGEKLMNMNKTYMIDVLGMINTATQQKMSLLIQEYSKESDKYEDYNVYSWGRNEKGQLCLNPCGIINNLTKVKLPENQEIVECLGDSTLIRNTKTQELSVNILEQNGKVKWEPITSNKIWAISSFKSTFIYCESSPKKKFPQALSAEPIHTKKEKLRTAKNLIDQIQWDTNLNKEEFSVGYETRHDGNLECSFEDFIRSDIKEYSVLYFKEEGKIVWDKKSRLDIL